jgi:hypothetical protein
VTELRELEQQAISVRRLLNGHIRYLREKKQVYPQAVKEAAVQYAIEDENDDI